MQAFEMSEDSKANDYENLKKREVFYLARLHSSEIIVSEEVKQRNFYQNLPKTYLISIYNFNLFTNKPKFDSFHSKIIKL
jgi:hypothetical protein